MNYSIVIVSYTLFYGLWWLRTRIFNNRFAVSLCLFQIYCFAFCSLFMSSSNQNKVEVHCNSNTQQSMNNAVENIRSEVVCNLVETKPAL